MTDAPAFLTFHHSGKGLSSCASKSARTRKSRWLRPQPLVVILSDCALSCRIKRAVMGRASRRGTAPSRPGAGSASRWGFGGGVRNDAPPGAVGLGRVRNDGPSPPEGARGCRGSAERHPCPRGSGRAGVSLASRSGAGSGALGTGERAARTTIKSRIALAGHAFNREKY